MSQKKQSEPTFEDAFKRLEAITDMLEQGDMTLEASVKAFEEGMELVHTCTRRLNEAENRLEKLIKQDDGTYSTELMD